MAARLPSQEKAGGFWRAIKTPPCRLGRRHQHRRLFLAGIERDAESSLAGQPVPEGQCETLISQAAHSVLAWMFSSSLLSSLAGRQT